MTHAEAMAVQVLLPPQDNIWVAQQVAKAAMHWRAQGVNGEQYDAVIVAAFELAVIAKGGLRLLGMVR